MATGTKMMSNGLLGITGVLMGYHQLRQRVLESYKSINKTTMYRRDPIIVPRVPPCLIQTLVPVMAIINAMVAAETMEGINGNKAYALPHDLLIKTLKKYNRLKE